MFKKRKNKVVRVTFGKGKILPAMTLEKRTGRGTPRGSGKGTNPKGGKGKVTLYPET